jgi:hypothetical protein
MYLDMTSPETTLEAVCYRRLESEETEEPFGFVEIGNCNCDVIESAAHSRPPLPPR